MARKPRQGQFPGQNGRPPKEIDKSEFEEMCLIQCTREEICSIFQCDEMTLNAWCVKTYGVTFSLVFAEKSTGGKKSLRRAQWHKATLEKDASMLRWLGKQMLDQSDKITNRNINSDVTHKDIMEEIADARKGKGGGS